MDVMRLGREYRKAVKGDAGCVFNLIQSTIKTVYPKYYSQKVVDFFVSFIKKKILLTIYKTDMFTFCCAITALSERERIQAII